MANKNGYHILVLYAILVKEKFLRRLPTRDTLILALSNLLQAGYLKLEAYNILIGDKGSKTLNYRSERKDNFVLDVDYDILRIFLFDSYPNHYLASTLEVFPVTRFLRDLGYLKKEFKFRGIIPGWVYIKTHEYEEILGMINSQEVGNWFDFLTSYTKISPGDFVIIENFVNKTMSDHYAETQRYNHLNFPQFD